MPEDRHRINSAILATTTLLRRNPLFLDTETTGLTDRDQVIDLAILDQTGQTLFNSLISPTIPPGQWSPSITTITGIQPNDLNNAPSLSETYPQIHAILKDRVVITYGADFDSKMLLQSCVAHSLPPFPVAQYACFLRLYAQFHGQPGFYTNTYKWQSLSTAAAQCCITPPAHLHRALADVTLLRLLFLHLANLPLLP